MTARAFRSPRIGASSHDSAMRMSLPIGEARAYCPWLIPKIPSMTSDSSGVPSRFDVCM